jgi:hypothetical protein
LSIQGREQTEGTTAQERKHREKTEKTSKIVVAINRGSTVTLSATGILKIALKIWA